MPPPCKTGLTLAGHSSEGSHQGQTASGISAADTAGPQSSYRISPISLLGSSFCALRATLSEVQLSSARCSLFAFTSLALLSFRLLSARWASNPTNVSSTRSISLRSIATGFAALQAVCKATRHGPEGRCLFTFSVLSTAVPLLSFSPDLGSPLSFALVFLPYVPTMCMTPCKLEVSPSEAKPSSLSKPPPRICNKRSAA